MALFTKEQWQWIADREEEGYSHRELAEFLGVHRETVRRGLVRRGMKPGSRRNLPSLNRRDFPGMTGGTGGEEPWKKTRY